MTKVRGSHLRPFHLGRDGYVAAGSSWPESAPSGVHVPHQLDPKSDDLNLHLIM